MMLNSISTLQCKVSPIRNMGMTAEKYKITFKLIQFNQKYHHPEKYSVISSQILANWKWDQPDDDFEQFASARIWFQPPNSKLVLLEIWRYLQRNTAWVPHKYLWIGNKINPMMILSSLLLPEVDFNLPILKLVLVEIWGYLQRNTASLPHKYMWIRNMIIVMTIFSILIDFPFFRSQIWPPVPEICHSEIRKHLQRNTILESHKYMWIGNMIIVMMMLNSLLLPELHFLLPIQR